jgi:hypothetical protein
VPGGLGQFVSAPHPDPAARESCPSIAAGGSSSVSLSPARWLPVLRQCALTPRGERPIGPYSALEPRTGSLRLSRSELERHRTARALTESKCAAAWKPRGVARRRPDRVDGRHLGLIHVLDKETGDFSELDEAALVQLM